MVTHSNILAWRIPWTEEPGGLQSVGSQRVGHDLATKQQRTWFTAAAAAAKSLQSRGWGHRPNAPDSPVRS